MLEDNIIAYDCLESEKHSIKELTGAVMETENQNLKQTLLQMRNQAEQDQEEIYHVAEQNGWYLSAAKANPQEVSRFHNFFQQNYQAAQIQTGYNTGGNQQQEQKGYRPPQQSQQRQQGQQQGGQQIRQRQQQSQNKQRQQNIQYNPSSQYQGY